MQIVYACCGRFSGRFSIMSARALVKSLRTLRRVDSSCCRYWGIPVAAVVVVQRVALLCSSVLGFPAISPRVRAGRLFGSVLWTMLWWVGSVLL